MQNWKKKKTKQAKVKKAQNNGPSSTQKETVKKIVQEVEANDRRRDKKSVEGAIKDGLELIKAEKLLTRNGQHQAVQLGEISKGV